MNPRPLVGWCPICQRYNCGQHFLALGEPFRGPPSVPVGEPEAGGPWPDIASSGAVERSIEDCLSAVAGITLPDLRMLQGAVRTLCAAQHKATRTALLAELAGKAGEEIGALVEQYRDLIVAEAGESNLTQANEYLADLKSVEQRILAHVAALAAERDDLEEYKDAVQARWPHEDALLLHISSNGLVTASNKLAAQMALERIKDLESQLRSVPPVAAPDLHKAVRAFLAAYDAAGEDLGEVDGSFVEAMEDALRLERIEELATLDPAADSPEGEELGRLALEQQDAERLTQNLRDGAVGTEMYRGTSMESPSAQTLNQWADEESSAAPDRGEREAALEGPWKAATFEGTFGPVWYIDGPAAPKGEEQARAVANALNLLASRALPGATEPRGK